MRISRREFLLGAAATGGLAASGGIGSLGRALAGTTPNPLPKPEQSGIEHVVVVCMENRSFDHFLGWVSIANGVQSGLTYLDDNGNPHQTHRLHDWTGCGF